MKLQTVASIASVTAAFNQLNTSGSLLTLTGGSDYSSIGESHLQGIARYGNYYLISQNRYGHDQGKLYFFDATTLAFVNAIHLPADSSTQDSNDHNYNHPGGIQVIANYLLIPIQTQDYNQSKIQLWDLSPLDSGSTDITLLNNDFIPDSDTRKIGGIGVTAVNNSYVVAACNNTLLYFYQSTGDDLETTSFTYLFEYQMPFSADEVCLVTEETTNNIFLIALYSTGTEPMADYAPLYQVDLTSQTLTQVTNTHFNTNYNGVISPLGVHFRYGSGIYVTDSGALNLFATQRVMQENCEINIFE